MTPITANLPNQNSSIIRLRTSLKVLPRLDWLGFRSKCTHNLNYSRLVVTETSSWTAPETISPCAHCAVYKPRPALNATASIQIDIRVLLQLTVWCNYGHHSPNPRLVMKSIIPVQPIAGQSAIFKSTAKVVASLRRSRRERRWKSSLFVRSRGMHCTTRHRTAQTLPHSVAWPRHS